MVGNLPQSIQGRSGDVLSRTLGVHRQQPDSAPRILDVIQDADTAALARPLAFPAQFANPVRTGHHVAHCRVAGYRRFQVGQFLFGEVIVGKAAEYGQFDESVHDVRNLTTFVDSGQSTSYSPLRAV